MSPRRRLLVTCEHGGNRVPSAYRHLFQGKQRILDSHCGYDPGALELARLLARHADTPLVYSTVSRLLVELNRSPGHPALFSVMTRSLNASQKRAIVSAYYEPYRARVEAAIVEATARGEPVLHLSVHTFTPKLRGVVRTADIGLLYDPSRTWEKEFCRTWGAAFARMAQTLRIRRNYPYRGNADGLVTYLRRRHQPEQYAALELEVNQRHVRKGGDRWRDLRRLVADTFLAAWNQEWLPRRQ